MNKANLIVLQNLDNMDKPTQRLIAKTLHLSLGKANSVLKALQQDKCVTENYTVTQKGKLILESGNTRKAVILAAGIGFRMFPLNKHTNKALLKIQGTTMIERLIMQLHEVCLFDITIVVGYRKEDFEFLIDRYGVKLSVNHEYETSSTILSLDKSKSDFCNCYIIPADLYFEENPFRKQELYSWYMLSCQEYQEEQIGLQNKEKISASWFQHHEEDMVGLAFIHKDQSQYFKYKIDDYILNQKIKDKFWEHCIFDGGSSILYPIFIKQQQYIECNTCEDLIRIDPDSESLNIEVFNIITNVFHVQRYEIQDIVCAKAGMTNNSFLFLIHGKKYMMRIPGEGTFNLINRIQEDSAYKAIKRYHISDEVLYFDKRSGYKITEFIEESHNCDPYDWSEVEKAMQFLHNFHDLGLTVEHEFDIFDKIEYYETLWGKETSIYKDYDFIKSNVAKLKRFIDSQEKHLVLTHIDAVPDNFLFFKDGDSERIKLIDWEYAAMQDPHVDLAMFSIYALYEKDQIDRLIDIYFSGACDLHTRIKIYCYVAACGLLWSNWCEYKRQLGVEFGEYSIRQYRYAKDFYKVVIDEIGELHEI